MKKILLPAMMLISLVAVAQQDTTKVVTDPKPASPLTFSGYIEAYYSYDFNKTNSNNKAGFLYSHNRNNEFNVNLAFVKASYNTERIRANLSIAAGTYMNANYAAEPGTLKNIYEANAGVEIGKKNLWLDAGIFSSHIGFESAVSKDCWTVTRSILAENSPYFESGAKLGYTSDNGKWFLSALALNGWQRITRVDGNSLMSFGTQVQYKPSGNVTLNYSTFIGTDKPDSTRQMRYFHNLYGIFTLNKKLAITAGFDIGTEQKAKRSSNMNTWYSPVLIVKYTPSAKWAFAARGEYYSDKNGVIINTETSNGFKTAGFSLNADYAPATNVLLRIEGRTLNSKDEIFAKENTAKKSNAFITTSIAISF